MTDDDLERMSLGSTERTHVRLEQERAYDLSNVIAELKGLAMVRLSGEFTLELTDWIDGTFQVKVYHTINSSHSNGGAYYRERLSFSATDRSEGWLLHQVVRRCEGETGEDVVYSERFGGYTPDWSRE